METAIAHLRELFLKAGLPSDSAADLINALNSDKSLCSDIVAAIQLLPKPQQLPEKQKPQDFLSTLWILTLKRAEIGDALRRLIWLVAKPISFDGSTLWIDIQFGWEALIDIPLLGNALSETLGRSAHLRSENTVAIDTANDHIDATRRSAISLCHMFSGEIIENNEIAGGSD